MADFSLNKLWSSFGKDGNSLNLSVYNQRPGFVVFTKDGGGKPAFKFSMCPEATIQMREMITRLLAAPPDTKDYMTQNQWDPNTRQSKKIGQITFVKDEKGMYTIEVVNPQSGSALSFVLKAPSNFDIGGDGLSPVKRSELSLKALLDMLNNIHSATFISPRVVPNRGNGKFGGGNNNNRSSEDDSSLFD